jgi:hypothetical protein
MRFEVECDRQGVLELALVAEPRGDVVERIAALRRQGLHRVRDHLPALGGGCGTKLFGDVDQAGTERLHQGGDLRIGMGMGMGM